MIHVEVYNRHFWKNIIIALLKHIYSIAVPGRDSIASQPEPGKDVQAMFRSKKQSFSGARIKGVDSKNKSVFRTTQERKKSSSPSLTSVSKDLEMSKSEMLESTLKTSGTSVESRVHPSVSSSAQAADLTGREQLSAKYKLGRRSSKIPKPSSVFKTQEK